MLLYKAGTGTQEVKERRDVAVEQERKKQLNISYQNTVNMKGRKKKTHANGGESHKEGRMGKKKEWKMTMELFLQHSGCIEGGRERKGL